MENMYIYLDYFFQQVSYVYVHTCICTFMVYMCIYLCLNTAYTVPWYCEAQHLAPLYVSTYSKVTINLS